MSEAECKPAEQDPGDSCQGDRCQGEEGKAGGVPPRADLVEDVVFSAGNSDSLANENDPRKPQGRQQRCSTVYQQPALLQGDGNIIVSVLEEGACYCC